MLAFYPIVVSRRRKTLNVLQIYLVSLRFSVSLTLCRISVDISVFQLQQLPEVGAPSYILTVSPQDLFSVQVGLEG
jgi:hypothetical protein